MLDLDVTDETPLPVKRVLKDGTVVYDLGAARMPIGGFFERPRRRRQRG